MITFGISLGRFNFRKLSLISERPIIFFRQSGCFGDLADGKFRIFGGRSIGKFFSNDTNMGNQNCVFHHGIAMISEHLSCLTFAVAAPIRLIGANA